MLSLKKLFVVCALFVTTEAFTTKKQEKRAVFGYQAVKSHEGREEASNTHVPVFTLPPSVVAASLPLQQFAFVEEEEEDVPYGVALVSCMLSLALGFGLGYGT